jgi:hypothetical protein
MAAIGRPARIEAGKTTPSSRPNLRARRPGRPHPRDLHRRDGDPFLYCPLAVRLAAGCFEVAVADINAPTRGPNRIARARQVAMYLAHVGFGLPLTAVGAAFRRDRTTAAHACRQVEDRRDDPAFDAALADLELAARIIVELRREGGGS